jgi:hypothetical protein
MNFFSKKFFSSIFTNWQIQILFSIIFERFLKNFFFFYVFDRTYTNHTYEKSKFHHENSSKMTFFEKIIFLSIFTMWQTQNLFSIISKHFLGKKIF